MSDVKSICLEAHRLTTQDRRDEYGHPLDDFTIVANLWAVLLGVPLTPHQVVLCMIALKMARLIHNPGHRDSKVDIAGYANCLDMIVQRMAELEAAKAP